MSGFLDRARSVKCSPLRAPSRISVSNTEGGLATSTARALSKPSVAVTLRPAAVSVETRKTLWVFSGSTTTTWTAGDGEAPDTGGLYEDRRASGLIRINLRT